MNNPSIKLVFIFFGSLLLSCNSKTPCEECRSCQLFNYDNEQPSLVESVQNLNSDSISTTSNTEDLQQSFAVIKKKFGEQWDFCDCVVKGDSLNKALSNEKLDDKELDQLLRRFEEIDRKCQAFKIMEPNRTPKEREFHEKKVKKCLSQARQH